MYNFFLIRLFLGLILIMGCESKSTENNFIPELATQLGTEYYGMNKYTIAFLKKRLNRDLYI